MHKNIFICHLYTSAF